VRPAPISSAIRGLFFNEFKQSGPEAARMEIADAGARLMIAPDWKPIVWSEAERRKGQAWG
jgi:catechol 2,3-dioxygenase